MSKSAKARTTPKSKATMDVMFRGVPMPVYKALKVKAAKEGIYLKDLIVRALEREIKAA
jgi:predicted HicB family RNase H-like nuclease